MNTGINNNSYFVVYRWMSNILGLGGNELSIFSLIYSFTINTKENAEIQGFYGNIELIEDWFKITAPTAIKCLNKLVEKNYVTKELVLQTGYIKKYTYRANLEKLRKMGCIID